MWTLHGLAAEQGLDWELMVSFIIGLLDEINAIW
jgi:hypothetical protein